MIFTRITSIRLSIKYNIVNKLHKPANADRVDVVPATVQSAVYTVVVTNSIEQDKNPTRGEMEIQRPKYYMYIRLIYFSKRIWKPDVLYFMGILRKSVK